MAQQLIFDLKALLGESYPSIVNSLHPGSSTLPNCGNALLQILLK